MSRKAEAASPRSSRPVESVLPPATLLVNPAAGRGRFVRGEQPTWRLSRVIDVLARRFDLRWELTKGPGEATGQARAAEAAGTQVVFALGGDGTLRECAEGLLGTAVPLGLLAGGTTNVLVSSLGLPSNALEAAERYCQDSGSAKPSVRPLDVGLCGDRPFLMMMSRGFDGRALVRVSKRLKRRVGKLAVGLSALNEFLRHPEPYFPVQWQDAEGLSCEHQSTFLTICNVPHYGGKFLMAPTASPFDRLLDVVSLNAHGRWSTARFAAAVARGRAATSPNVQTAKLTSLTLEGSGAALVQLDGDPYTVTLPTTVRLAKQRLLLIWPK